MGFLSLFSRKRSSSKLSGRLLKSQAYDATIASEPPQRGAYPVAGNGPNVLDTLSKSAKFKSTQFPLHFDIEDACAPSPPVPRFRGDEAPRPKTAPNGSKSGASPSKDSSKRQSTFRGRTLSFRKSRVISNTTPDLPDKSATPEFAQYGQGFVQVFPPGLPSLPASLPAVTSPIEHAHRRTKSMLSDGGRSVDLLDAQSELSPQSPDFRTRVEAAGFRSFGEDVADRNIAMSLDSSHVKAFYTPAAENRTRPPNRDLPLTSVSKDNPKSSTTSRSQAGSLAKSPPLRLFPDQTPLAKNGAASKPAKDNSGLLQASTTGLKRQGSLSQGTYVPSGSTSGNLANSSARMRAQSLHRAAPSKDTSTPSLPDRPATSWDPRNDDASSQVPHYIPRRQEEDAERWKKSKIPVATPFRQSTHPATKFHSRFQTYQPKSDGRPGTSSNVGSVPRTSTSAASDPRPSSSRANSGHVLELPASFAVSDGSDWFAGLDDTKSAPSPCVSISHTHSERSEPRGRRCPRTQSMFSLSRRGGLEDISEFVPERTSSIRRWSMGSDTLSTSSLGSCVHTPRPQSVLTPETSIDLSFQGMKKSVSKASIHPPRSRGSIYSTNAQGILEIVQDIPANHGNDHREDFNIDDYVSSDDDSFVAPRHPRVQDGENLLFRDGGYGVSQLPGLSHSYATTEPASAPVVRGRAPPVSMSNHSLERSSSKKSPRLPGRSLDSIASVYSTRKSISKSHSRFRRPSMEVDDSSDGEIDSLRDRHGRPRESRQQSPSHKGQNGLRRLSVTAVKYDNKSNIEIIQATRTCVCGAYADEPKPEKPKSFAAARRRKQEKIRERTMQLAQRGRSIN
ncbi:hypothetical protein PpBr36_01200 [Pyricularia pennisetigena]|uniref:hypothetical protein n=1 Tax=Pyricularia pennisetigena TaxID=1578925 RepID=UPI001152B236|nr:hypothetical protein PpBr36_01200 [Pyricularia pennisetigena]TLS27740.1 hypothetical protein PpBr36_01200 [Pyricularia pennisetigena]